MNINGRQVDIESQRKEPLLKRIFSSKEFSQFDVENRNDMSQSTEASLSLLEIVKLNDQ